MLLIFGVKKKQKKSGKITSDSCETCSFNSYTYYNTLKYFHVFYIPVAYVGKTSTLICDNCNKVYTEEMFNESKKNSVNRSRLKAEIPAYYFTGLIIAAFLSVTVVPCIYYQHEKYDKQNEQRLNNPLLGDYYIYDDKKAKLFGEKTKAGKYTSYGHHVLKLTKIEDAKYHFILSDNVYTSYFRAERAIDKDAGNTNYFSNKTVIFEKEKIKKFITDNKLEVYRKK